MGAIVDIVFKNPHFMAYQAQTIFSLHQYIGNLIYFNKFFKYISINFKNIFLYCKTVIL